MVKVMVPGKIMLGKVWIWTGVGCTTWVLGGSCAGYWKTCTRNTMGLVLPCRVSVTVLVGMNWRPAPKVAVRVGRRGQFPTVSVCVIVLLVSFVSKTAFVGS